MIECVPQFHTPTPRGRCGSFFARSAATRFLVVVALLPLTGCISVQKFDQPPTVLREAIRNGEIVEPGERVSVVTATQGELVFRVTELDGDAIHGVGVEVPIDDVVALQTQRVDVLRTAAVAVGWYYLLGATFVLAFLIAG